MKVKLDLIARMEYSLEIEIPDDIDPDDSRAVLLWAATNNKIDVGDGEYLNSELLYTKELKNEEVLPLTNTTPKQSGN